MALKIKSYPNMNVISYHKNARSLTPILEEISAHNGIGHETHGCTIGQTIPNAVEKSVPEKLAADLAPRDYKIQKPNVLLEPNRREDPVIRRGYVIEVQEQAYSRT